MNKIPKYDVVDKRFNITSRKVFSIFVLGVLVGAALLSALYTQYNVYICSYGAGDVQDYFNGIERITDMWREWHL